MKYNGLLDVLRLLDDSLTDLILKQAGRCQNMPFSYFAHRSSQYDWHDETSAKTCIRMKIALWYFDEILCLPSYWQGLAYEISSTILFYRGKAEVKIIYCGQLKKMQRKE